MNHFESVAGVLFDVRREKVLLTQRRDVPVWVCPGGGVEVGESPVCAIEREFLEETGLTVQASRLVGIYRPINRLAKTTLLYECTPLHGHLTLSSETLDVAFFSLKTLPRLIPPPYLEWIDDAYKIAPPVEKMLSSITYRALVKQFLCHPILVARFLLSRIGFAINS